MRKRFLKSLNFKGKEVKDMRKVSVFVVALVLSTVLSWSIAFAIPGLPAMYKMKFEDFEWISPTVIGPGQDLANGVEDNWGIFKVTSIIDRLATTTTWSDGGGGYQITGIFYNIDIDDVDPKGAGFTINSTNRIIQPQLDLYIQKAGEPGYTSFSPTGGPAARTGLNTYPTVTDGTLLVSARFMPGILPVAFVAPYADVAPFDPLDTVINLDIDGLTSPFTGDGAGYLDVIPGSGAWASYMDTDSFKLFLDSNNDGVPDMPVSRDMFFEFDIRPHPDTGLPNWEWIANSEDPVIGYAVPEPCTLLLLGTGLIGLGRYGRKKLTK
ncbi:MAG: PEP-CTERM sorting domain-containing protein [Desulfovibrionales bacterium]|nr:PEP-CTERM sorting domain-containing protein [Desulfovibrionales bacterium]